MWPARRLLPLCGAGDLASCMLEATVLESLCVCRDDPRLWKPALVHRRLSDRHGRAAKACGAGAMPAAGVRSASSFELAHIPPAFESEDCSRISCHKPKIALPVAVAGMEWIGRESMCRSLERLRILWNYCCLCSRASRRAKAGASAGASCRVISASCDQF